MKENKSTSNSTINGSIFEESTGKTTEIGNAPAGDSTDLRTTPIETLPTVLNATQLAAVLGISRAGAYNLLNSQDFPTLHIGARKLVATGKLMDWIDRHSNGGVAV